MAKAIRFCFFNERKITPWSKRATSFTSFCIDSLYSCRIASSIEIYELYTRKNMNTSSVLNFCEHYFWPKDRVLLNSLSTFSTIIVWIWEIFHVKCCCIHQSQWGKWDNFFTDDITVFSTHIWNVIESKLMCLFQILKMCNIIRILTSPSRRVSSIFLSAFRMVPSFTCK